MLLPALPGGPGAGGLLATLLGSGLQVGSSFEFSIFLIVFLLFSGVDVLLLVLHGVAVLLLVLHGLVGDVEGPGGPVGGVGLAEGGRGLQVGSSSKFLIFLILFLFFSGSAVLLLVLHGLGDDVRGPEGPVGDEGLADGGQVAAAEASGAVSFLNSCILFVSLLLIGSPCDGVPPDPGLGAGLRLQLPDVVVGGLSGGIEAW